MAKTSLRTLQNASSATNNWSSILIILPLFAGIAHLWSPCQVLFSWNLRHHEFAIMLLYKRRLPRPQTPDERKRWPLFRSRFRSSLFDRGCSLWTGGDPGYSRNRASGHAIYRQSSVVGSGENRKRVPCGVQASGKRCNIYASTSEIWTYHTQRHIGTCLVHSTLPGGGGTHMKLTGMLVVLVRGVNLGFWSRLGCSWQSASILCRQGLV